MELQKMQYIHIIQQALAEDIGSGDVTTNSIVPPEAHTRAIIHTKQAGVVAGLAVAGEVFATLNPSIQFTQLKQDGDRVAAGEVLAELKGSARTILTGERVALNLLQRMSGIATKTAAMAALIEDYQAVLVDTRKTTPGLRILEKY
ncbi:MAG TPA: nicotinate-nucleotide diphosphorylase (carboxylating), partial [Bacillota bacterium]|nr:nicotinate-nucleotide diphosphorylase (carboxylating) [Bacillota bacterium]